MDLLALLEAEHHALREQLTEIRKNLFESNVKSELFIFTEHLLLHEELEEKLLIPTIKKINPSIEISDFQTKHKIILEKIRELQFASESKDTLTFQKLFFQLHAIFEEHFASEERLLYPIIEGNISETEMAELTQKAVSIFENRQAAIPL